jgi:hypothetical protein
MYEALARVTLPNLRVLAIRHLRMLNYAPPHPERDARFDIPLDAMPSLRECYFNQYKCARPWLTRPTGNRPHAMDVFQIGYAMNPDGQGLASDRLGRCTSGGQTLSPISRNT